LSGHRIVNVSALGIARIVFVNAAIFGLDPLTYGQENQTGNQERKRE
jgi:hypothetical protein